MKWMLKQENRKGFHDDARLLIPEKKPKGTKDPGAGLSPGARQ